jgi:hypothetical protein
MTITFIGGAFCALATPIESESVAATTCNIAEIAIIALGRNFASSAICLVQSPANAGEREYTP